MNNKDRGLEIGDQGSGMGDRGSACGRCDERVCEPRSSSEWGWGPTSASNGAQAMLVGSTGPFVFQNVPMGLHAVQVVKNANPNKGSIVAQTTFVSLGNGQSQLIELWF